MENKWKLPQYLAFRICSSATDPRVLLREGIQSYWKENGNYYRIQGSGFTVRVALASSFTREVMKVAIWVIGGNNLLTTSP